MVGNYFLLGIGCYSPLDLPSITYTDAKVSSSITIGTGVSQWSSLSGTQNLTQATGSAQPTYNLTGLDGGPAVVFDGVNDQLFGQMASGSFTIIMLVKTSTASPSGFLFGFNNGNCYLWHGSGNTFEVNVGGVVSGKNIAAGWLNNNKAKIVIWRYDGTHAGNQILVNGIVKTTTNGIVTNNPGSITATQSFLMSRRVTDNFNSGAVSYFNYRNRYLTDAQINEEVKFILKDKLPTALLNSNGLPVLDANQDLTY